MQLQNTLNKMVSPLIIIVFALGVCHGFHAMSTSLRHANLSLYSSSNPSSSNLKNLAFASTFLVSSILAPPPAALAESSKIIGEISGSGLVFKDTLTVERFVDPKIDGVTLYISNFQRPLTERIQKDFFSDPSFASVGCAKTSPRATIDPSINKSKGGEEVFEEAKSLLFKTLRVQRIYDEEKNAVVYVSFNTRLDKGSDSNKSRFKSSICAVSLE